MQLLQVIILILPEKRWDFYPYPLQYTIQIYDFSRFVA